MKTAAVTTTGCVLVFLGSCVETGAGGQKVPVKYVPQAVLDTVKDKFPKAEVLGATVEILRARHRAGLRWAAQAGAVRQGRPHAQMTSMPQVSRRIAAPGYPKR
jgi:hypothetical protein